MAETHSKSKLKRNKSSVKDLEPEITSSGAVRRTFPRGSAAQPGRSVAPAAVWWSHQQLPAVESLWASILKCALLEDQHWDLPHLTHSSAARPAALKLDEQRWCDLSGEVAPLPQSSQAPTQRPRPSLHRWEEPASSDEKSEEEESGAVNREQLLTNQEKSDRQVSLQGEAEHKEEVQRSDGGAAGGAGLQSCPICLLVFHVGSTQMDCDGHLAQCLSEANMDMTW
ncbi:uncharacterized protein si:ch73-70k4.1 isoform X2 [Cottoperca gobio]|uniref:Uncharacterized protein si:ch73-70k4.1 isoform X2 n=1 Tax=Cottoperca gobio TaxID=56716 RepID=A0A6J2PZV5_COTGO|nr:Fanconi anemia core complex-associated protein 20 isoform X2 [Cottoperca gobio]